MKALGPSRYQSLSVALSDAICRYLSLCQLLEGSLVRLSGAQEGPRSVLVFPVAISCCLLLSKLWKTDTPENEPRHHGAIKGGTQSPNWLKGSGWIKWRPVENCFCRFTSMGPLNQIPVWGPIALGPVLDSGP